ncbi:MAG: SRPBCC family protein, partial [Candidatus Eremiobacteraeota bacterium]|nr:SRPBCC family protein [Candidatus Eremiobacteraeota bacterium]
HAWHPAIKNCTSQDGKVRELTLADGGRIFETLLNDGALTYTYHIDKSPLPVKNYVATLRVLDAGQNACRVEWEATFEPSGASEDEAVKLIGGIFQDGLDNL